jgi:hypothetical protein
MTESRQFHFAGLASEAEQLLGIFESKLIECGRGR